jgi:class 3 adenylate cyclase
LISSRIASAVEGLIELEELGTLTLKGLLKPVTVFNAIGVKTSG